jgi:hypothetical protein
MGHRQRVSIFLDTGPIGAPLAIPARPECSQKDGDDTDALVSFGQAPGAIMGVDGSFGAWSLPPGRDVLSAPLGPVSCTDSGRFFCPDGPDPAPGIVGFGADALTWVSSDNGQTATASADIDIDMDAGRPRSIAERRDTPPGARWRCSVDVIPELAREMASRCTSDVPTRWCHEKQSATPTSQKSSTTLHRRVALACTRNPLSERSSAWNGTQKHPLRGRPRAGSGPTSRGA